MQGRKEVVLNLCLSVACIHSSKKLQGRGMRQSDLQGEAKLASVTVRAGQEDTLGGNVS